MCGLTFFTNSILYAIIEVLDFRCGRVSGRLITIYRIEGVIVFSQVKNTNTQRIKRQKMFERRLWCSLLLIAHRVLKM
jgi:hypothetical protein